VTLIFSRCLFAPFYLLDLLSSTYISESSELQVNISRPSLFYYAGEQVTGDISFQNTQDVVTVGAIFLEAIGEMGYTTPEIRQYLDKNGNARTEHYTKTHIIPFMKIRIPIVQASYGQVKISITNK
jgi:hypothetical protein